MDRAEKEDLVASLHRTFSETAVVLVTHYSGLTVAEIGDLRKRMREAGAGLKVTKNRLTVRALEGTRYAEPGGPVQGTDGDRLRQRSGGGGEGGGRLTRRPTPSWCCWAAGVGGQMLDAEGVRALATLPSLDELRGKLIGLLNAPATRIAGVLQAPAGQLARVFAAYADKDKDEAKPPDRAVAIGAML